MHVYPGQPKINSRIVYEIIAGLILDLYRRYQQKRAENKGAK